MIIRRKTESYLKFGFNLVSEQCALLCSSILLQRLSSLLLLFSDLGLDRDLPQAGVSVPKIEKADYESVRKT